MNKKNKHNKNLSNDKFKGFLSIITSLSPLEKKRIIHLISGGSPKVGGSEFGSQTEEKNQKTNRKYQAKGVINTPKHKILKRNTDKVTDKGLLKGSFDIFQLVLQNLLNSVNKKELLGNFDLASSIDEVQSMHNRFITELGLEFGTKKYKLVTSYCIQLLEGVKDPLPVDRLSTGRVDKWPNTLGTLRPLFHQVRDKGPYYQVGDQIIRSLFAMQRIVEDFSELSLKSIEHKAKVDPLLLSEYEDFLMEFYHGPVTDTNTGERNGEYGLFKEFLNDYTLEMPLNYNSSGPNGVRKDESACLEAYLLCNNKELFPHFTKLCELTNNMVFHKFVCDIANEYQKEKDRQKVDLVKDTWLSSQKEEISSQNLRKITAVPDSGNKSRTVAIADFWTQCLLTPFEKAIMDFIHKSYPDCAYMHNHGGGFENLKSFIKEGTVCLDAESWTDTFSVQFQKAHVRHLYGREFSSAWAGLVVHCRWKVKDTDKYIRYLTGQGMGTKGSFVIASLAYLSIMEFLMRKHYKEMFPNSALNDRRGFSSLFNQVGDDSWNQDPKGLILKDIVEKVGIPINLTKSKFSKDGNIVGEFVSRNLNHGNDVSRISLKLCRLVKTNLFYLPTLFQHIEERTQSFDWDSFINELRDLKTPSGKLVFPNHIWVGLYRALIIDSIINDKALLKVFNSLERNLSIKGDSLFELRYKFESEDKLNFFKLLLILQDCEYMYSRIQESLDNSRKEFQKFPFGTFTKIFKGLIWDINLIPNKNHFNDYCRLYIAYKVKEIVEPELFKLSFYDSKPSDGVPELLRAATAMQSELFIIFKDSIFGKDYLKYKMATKVRIDRCYGIQKKYLSSGNTPSEIMRNYVSYLPNLSSIGDLPFAEFSEVIGVVDYLYPPGE